MMKQEKEDKFFLEVAQKIATKSKCLSRKVGAILVRDNCIISTGYNGPARGVKHCNERTINFYNKLKFEFGLPNKIPDNIKINNCPRKEMGYESGEGLHLCQAAHAEMNAIVQAARLGIMTKGATIYITLNPCKNCMVLIINAGIKRLIYPKGIYYDKYSNIIAKESGIEICELNV